MYFSQFRIMQVRPDKHDLCLNCENMEICPLINALRDDLAVIRHKKIRIDDLQILQRTQEGIIDEQNSNKQINKRQYLYGRK